MPGNIGWQGLIVILVIVLLVFGPKRIPEIARSLGRGMREFKDSVTGENDHKDDATHVQTDQQQLPAPPADVTEPQPRERDTVV